MPGDPYPVVRAAVVQAAPVYLDRDASLEKAVGLIGEAAGGGAQIVALGETWLPGYPIWFDRSPGAAVWGSPSTKELHAELVQNSVVVPGPTTEALGASCREHGVYLAIGVHERVDRYNRGTLYNTILYFGPSGALLGLHRKLVPTYQERMVWGQGDGSTLTVIDTPNGRLGGLVCWEHAMPLARQAMHMKGEQIHVAVWPEVSEMHQVMSRHYAFEGRCFVLAAGSFVRVDDMPAHLPGLRDLDLEGVENGLLIDGGSAIYGPDGMPLAGPVHGQETILYADLDLRKIAEELTTLDVTGHYNRPDVFHLDVNEEPLQGIGRSTE
jgi:predicted amidohydrolase